MSTREPQNIKQIFEEKYARYLNIQQTIKAYQIIYETQRRQLEEIITTKEALKKIKTRKIREFEGFASLGSGVFIFLRGEMGSRVLVNIGANINLYMDIESAILELERREEKIKKDSNTTARTLQELIDAAEKLEKELIALQRYIESQRPS